MKEKRKRSICKAISWRLTATVTTFIVTYAITGKLSFAISISSIEVGAKMALYYFHERVWDKSKFGRIEKGPEYQI